MIIQIFFLLIMLCSNIIAGDSLILHISPLNEIVLSTNEKLRNLQVIPHQNITFEYTFGRNINFCIDIPKTTDYVNQTIKNIKEYQVSKFKSISYYL